jgi:retinol dehydrogenase-12
VTANCLHPGSVATRFGQSERGIFSAMVRLSMVFASRPERGAKTIVHLAALPDVANVTGRYFIDCREAVPSREAQDDAASESRERSCVSWSMPIEPAKCDRIFRKS